MSRRQRAPLQLSDDDDDLDLFSVEDTPSNSGSVAAPTNGEPSKQQVDLILSDESDDDDELNLLDFQKRLSPQNAKPKELPSASRSQEKDEDEPDWVREFSQNLPSEKERRKALASHYDDDGDSILDLVDDEPEVPVTQPSQPASAPDSAKVSDQKRPKKVRAPVILKSKMPLVTAPKLEDNLVLLQSADTALDLSGDIGAVGRVKMKNGSLFLDIKGVVYKGHTVPCNTACIVTIGDEDARVSAVLDEAVTLTVERNLFASDEVIIRGQIEEDEDDDMDNSGVDDEPIRPKKKANVAEASTKGRRKSGSRAKSGGVSKKSISKGARSKS